MNITNATDFFCSLSEQLFTNPLTKLKYTGAVQEIAEVTNSYWFLDVIASIEILYSTANFWVN